MKKLFLLAFALLLVGCGADEETKDAKTNTKSKTKTEKTKEVTPAESVPDKSIEEEADESEEVEESAKEVEFEEPAIEVVENESEDPVLIPVAKPTTPSVPKPVSNVNSYMSCVAGGGNTVITGQNEWSVCTSANGRKYSSKIPGIWAEVDISSETNYMACIMGGLPVDRTDELDPVCFMPDGRMLRQ